jgi:archaellum biogenesis ATPase FlaH
MTVYHQRIIDAELWSRLAATKIVVIEGPKSSGKTMTTKQVAKSSGFMDADQNARSAMKTDPNLVLIGAAPVYFHRLGRASCGY